MSEVMTCYSNKRMLVVFLLIFPVVFISCGNEDNDTKESNDELVIQVSELNGEKGYWALYNAHVEAIKIGKKVRYTGGELDITIPEDAKSIPLTNDTDFGGTIITVENKNIDGFFLFTLIGEEKPISISQNLLGGGDFTSVQELNKGKVLLLLWDENPWVKNRKGYSYGATRQDVILLNDGIAQNEPVVTWGNPDTTKPRVTYVQTDDNEKAIRNLTFNRTSSSTMKTMFVRVEFQNNVLIDNITINTPQNTNLYGDYVLRVYNSTNVTLRDVTINGTYSYKDQYSKNNLFGYGINMLNNWNTHFIRLNGIAKWGLFGTNNMNKVLLEDCNINRFDIHCYGRDITMKNCTFNDMYNQFSSVYGTIRYEHCTFNNHAPYLNNTSYNCFTPFALVIKDCVWRVQPHELPEALCVMGSLTNEYNERPELNKRAYPNIYIDGLKIETLSLFNEVYAIWTNEDVADQRPVENISEVVVNNLQVNDELYFKLWNKPVNTSNNVEFKMN